MRKILFASTAALLVSCAYAADNVVQNPDFGVGSGTLSNWDLIEFSGADPAPGLIGVSNQYWHSSRFSCSFPENSSSTINALSIRQDFGAVADIEEVSVWVLSVEQTFKAYLRYTDGTAELFQKFYQSPNLDTWSKWDLTSSLNAAKTLSGIEIRVDSGSANPTYAAYVDDVVVRANPVPEPATLLVLGAGALLLRKRKR